MSLNIKISRFLRNIGLISSATIVAQGITVLTLPILTRIYIPQDFEDFGVFVAFIAILSSVLSLRFNIAIPLSRDNKDFGITIGLSVFSSVTISTVLAGSYFVFKEFLPIIDYLEDEWFVLGIIFGALGMSIYNIFVAVAAYSKEFVAVSKSKVIRSIASNSTQVVFGLLSFSNGLLIGYVILCWAGAGIFLRKIAGILISSFRIPKAEIKKGFFEKIEYPIFSVPESLFFSLGSNLPIIIIAWSTQNAEAGAFFLALKFMSIPMMFLGQSISTVYMSYAPKEKTSEGLYRLTKDTVTKLFYFAGIPLIAIGLSAPFYVTFIFGPDWPQLGYYIAWLSIGSVFQLLSAPITISLHIMKRIKLAMVMQLILLFIKIFPMCAGLFYQSEFYLEIFAISNALAYILLMITIFVNLNRYVINTRNN